MASDSNDEDKMADPMAAGEPESTGPDIGDKYKIPLVFMKESALFGNRRPEKNEWLSHVELYKAIGMRIDASHIKGLQRVRGFWRIYLDCIQSKLTLMKEGVPLRAKVVPVLNTNPERLDGEQTTRIRVKNIPLSVDDGLIKRTLTLKDIEVISLYREKLRVNEKLTNCETGDRIIIVKTSTLKSPLPNFMAFGKYTGRVIHPGQKSRDEQSRPNKCSKCLTTGHKFPECPNDWVCTDCGVSGHRRAECPVEPVPAPSDQEASGGETDGASEGTGSGDDEYSTDASDGESSSKASESRGDQALTPGGAKQRHNVSFVQATIDTFLTPNTGRRGVSLDRSPPTPVEQLHDNQADTTHKRRKQKKNGKSQGH